MYLALFKIGRADYKTEDVARINLDDLDESLLAHCLFETVATFRDYQQRNPGISPDTIGKSREFVDALLANFSKEKKGQDPRHSSFIAIRVD